MDGNDDRNDRSPAATSRRAFFTQAAGIAGLLPVVATGAAVAGWPPNTAQAQTPATAQASQPPAGYTLLGPEEAAFVEALVNLMCPADAMTPNGVDCGLAVFIDRQLAGDFGKGGRLYSQGPWTPGKPQHGYQLPLKPAEFFIAGIAAASAAAQTRYSKSFDQLAAADAESFLQDIAAGRVTETRVSLADWFSQLVYPLFQQACFADPVYGGNRDKVFWRMVGYPGLPAFHAQDMVQYRGKPYPPAQKPQSIQDFS